MKKIFRDHEIEFTLSANNRPNAIKIDGKLFTMSNTAERFGYSWRSGADGNHLYYSSAEGEKIDGCLIFEIPQRKFVEWRRDAV